MHIRTRRARGHHGGLQDGLPKRCKEKWSIRHLMGVDHTRLTDRFAGRYFRLTDVHGNVTRTRLA